MSASPRSGGLAVLVATRDPRGAADHGRMTVLRTIVDALVCAHDEVIVGYCGPPAEHGAGSERWSPERVRFVSLADGPVGRTLHGLRQLAVGPRSFNLAAGLTRRSARRFAELLVEEGQEADLFVLDGVRSLAMLGEVGDIPVHVDLDDLLSERYRAWARLPFRRLPFDVRGTRPQSPVNRVARLGRGVLPSVMRWEARAAAVVEDDVCRRATSVSLVSAAEADRLAVRSGRPVAALPMAMPLAETSWEPPAEPRFDAVFLGRPTFLPNLAAVGWLADEMFPSFEELCGRRPRVAVVGRATPSVTRWIRDLGMEPMGFVDDLAGLLGQCAVALAPQVVGGGVKTKVLEYGSHAMPIIGTPEAFEGVERHGEEPWLVGRTGSEFAAHLAGLLADPQRARRLGAAARAVVEAEFCEEIVVGRWVETLATVSGCGVTDGMPR